MLMDNHDISVFFFLFFLVITGCEVNNRYRICNSMGQQFYFAHEGR